jgi:pectin methylesterase-like acyl-CoA thioesterase
MHSNKTYRALLAAACLICTAPAVAKEQRIVVAADGSGDVRTVQEAFAAVPDNNDERIDMGEHTRPEGWNNWRKPDNEKTARYAEFNSRGPGASPARRVAWSRQLSGTERQQLTVAAILGGADGWRPD